MQDVFSKNPKMGDPASLAPQLDENSRTLDQLQQEIRKYEVCIVVIVQNLRQMFSLFKSIFCVIAHLDEQFLQFSGLGFITLGLFHCT